MAYKKLLAAIVEMSKEVLRSNLVGIYLHGSAAMGCFHPAASDLDLILIIEEDISDSAKLAFMNEIIQFNKEAPPKGLELSLVKREYCKPFVYPTPYEMHFSNGHLEWFLKSPNEYVEKMKGTDKDLAAHFANIIQYGIVLFGEEIESVFDSVPKEYFIDSLWYDISEAECDILKNPIYVTLNLCRALAYMREGVILSKKAGGEWGLNHLPQSFHDLIAEALGCYTSARPMKTDMGNAPDFASYMLSQIHPFVKE